MNMNKCLTLVQHLCNMNKCLTLVQTGTVQKMKLRYYILFANYEQGLALRDLLLKDNIPNRIAPAPRAIQGDLSCGMSLLIEPEYIDQARSCIEAHQAPYHRIASLEGQIQSHRDRYC